MSQGDQLLALIEIIDALCDRLRKTNRLDDVLASIADRARHLYRESVGPQPGEE